MNRSRRIAVVTGSRADYGHLYWLLKELSQAPDVTLQVIATGAHLAAQFGRSLETIRDDGFTVAASVPIPLDDDRPAGISHGISIGLSGFATVLDDLRPDLLVVLGDRFEMLSAAIAAMNARVPIAHIAGGETTEGAVDEAIRHSITKMALYHFPGGAEQRARIISMGEDPARVFCFGKPGLDNVMRLGLLGKDDVQKALGLRLAETTLVVTFHPTTLDDDSSGAHFTAVIDALERFPSATIVFTRPNADSRNHVISTAIDRYVAAHPGRMAAFPNLGTRLYLSLLKNASAVVGNSSSGLIEAPALRVPTVNIGDRQRGRVRAASVIDCAPEALAIERAIAKALSQSFRRTVSVMRPIYSADGTVSAKIAQALRAVPLATEMLKKAFYMPPQQTPRG